MGGEFLNTIFEIIHTKEHFNTRNASVPFEGNVFYVCFKNIGLKSPYAKNIGFFFFFF